MIKQPGHYPPCMPQVSTPAEKIEVALQRFNSELALFLIVATEHDFWIYSWFWGWCVSPSADCSFLLREPALPSAPAMCPLAFVTGTSEASAE